MKTYGSNDSVAQADRQIRDVERTAGRHASASATIADDRASESAIQNLQQLANRSPKALKLKQQAEITATGPRSARAVSYQQLADNSPQANRLIQPAAVATRSPTTPLQRVEKPNHTGLPDQLKSGIESLSGMSMDHVKVHYNSNKPAQMQAHAYAQGSEIHVAPGQERHLPHEAWHVVQQAQGRVQPTVQVKGEAVNDDPGLEHEADIFGAKALSAASQPGEAVAQRRHSTGSATVAIQAVWVNNQGLPLNDDLKAQVLNNPLQGLAQIATTLGLADAVASLQLRIAAVQSTGNTELIQEVNAGLLTALQTDQAWTIERLLGSALDHLNLPDDSMADPEHAEDEGGGNPEEELEKGDLALSEIDSNEQMVLAEALAKRQPELFQQFLDRAKSSQVQATHNLFLTWFNQGVLTRSQFKALGDDGSPMQMARTPGALSYQAAYATHQHGNFSDVTYKLDNLGSISFDKVHKKKVWQNPMQPGSEVQLNKGSGKANYGITLSGTKIKIPGASRGQHFSMANRIMKNGFGSSSPTGWTWHHLITYYKMVLVDRTVHAKHGHNGGVYVWK